MDLNTIMDDNGWAYVYVIHWFETTRHKNSHTEMAYARVEDCYKIFEIPHDEPYCIKLERHKPNSSKVKSALINSKIAALERQKKALGNQYNT